MGWCARATGLVKGTRLRSATGRNRASWSRSSGCDRGSLVRVSVPPKATTPKRVIYARRGPGDRRTQQRLDHGRDDVTASVREDFLPRRCRIREATFDNMVAAGTLSREDDRGAPSTARLSS
jgi:hypothetical protein